jgi:hypothetical protein
MKTRSWQRIDHLSKRLEFLQTSVPVASAPLRDDLSYQGNPASTQDTQAPHDIKQSYFLERRCFL